MLVNTPSSINRKNDGHSAGNRRTSRPDCFLIFLAMPAKHPAERLGVFVFGVPSMFNSSEADVHWTNLNAVKSR